MSRDTLIQVGGSNFILDFFTFRDHFGKKIGNENQPNTTGITAAEVLRKWICAIKIEL